MGFQEHFQSDRRAKPGAFAAMTLMCLVLLALLTAAQVVHIHANASDADHCLMCIAMHSAAPVVAAAAAIVLVRVWSPAPVLELRAVTRYWHPKLFTRPPPIGC
jgi:hypothetical protein